MKKISLFVIILTSLKSFAQFSQNKTIDSLKLALATAKEDTNKVWILDALSSSYTFSSADTAVIYAQQELRLSQQLNFREGMASGMAELGGALTT